MSQGEVESVTGEEGDLTVVVNKKARHIDPERCTGCGDCAQACPIELPNDFNKRLDNRKVAYKNFAQAFPGAYTISKLDTSPCTITCPANVNAHGYVSLLAQGRYQEALDVVLDVLPLPGTMGRICFHPCEAECRRGQVDEAVSICALKRVAADQADILEAQIPCAEPKPEKAAIVGAGPAGLSAAYHLARRGYRSTIFEALPVGGGMLRVGVPDYRLPPEVLEKEITALQRLGIEIKYNTPLGPDLTIDDLFGQGYQAVYLALGAHKGMKLGVPGEEAEGVVQGVTLLKDINLGQKPKLGKKAAVIGGGNVAMDVSRSLVRLGVEQVTIVYRRTRAEMPAWEEEIDAALEEGVAIEFLAAPVEVPVEGGRAAGLKCIRMQLGEPDASGRRRPEPIEGSEYVMDVDLIVPAIGQAVDAEHLGQGDGLAFTKWGTIVVDPVTYASNRPGVFAGGDMFSHPLGAAMGQGTAVGAIAEGKEAAESMARFIEGRDLLEGREAIDRSLDKNWRELPSDNGRKHRAHGPTISLEERTSTFKEVELGLDPETGRAEADRCISCGLCCECYRCVAACQAEAVTRETHAEKDERREIRVGSVVLAPGAEAYDPANMKTYLYGQHKNVVTAQEFERLLSSGGPTIGHLVRPGDHKEPRKVAWLQCVGSRDINVSGNGYCSSVCCMYALKEAIIAMEHSKDHPLECTIFYMDIRTFGKDFEHYYNKAKAEGVRFVRARVHTIDPDPDDPQNLRITYFSEEGGEVHETFDLAVLSQGLMVGRETVDLAQRLGVGLNKYNFVDASPFAPVNTNRPGIYAAGIFTGPKDIPTSVVDAGAAACAAAANLSLARGTDTKVLDLPAEMDVAGQEPRIGVFVCNCGINIGGVVDVPAVAEYAAGLPGVTFVDQALFTCSQDTQNRMKEVIEKEGLNRVVVASCSPRTHEPLFQETMREIGLNKYLFEMANIRDQNSWVHKEQPAVATEKAKDLIRMAVGRAARLKPLVEKTLGINKTALVIGGGVAGLTAALGLADQGYEAIILEKEARLGGLAWDLTATIEGLDIQKYLLDLIDRVKAHDKIQVLTDSLIIGFSGVQGNFTTEVLVGEGMYERKIEHGVVIVATGATEYQPSEFMYGEDERIVTQIQLGKRLEQSGAENLGRVTMIQCVGSRNDDHPGCSRVCCQTAVKNAIHIKEDNPDAQVMVLYRDMRTYGLLEDYYTQARRLGVIFSRYHADNPPVVSMEDGQVFVRYHDLILDRDVEARSDLVALSAGLRSSDIDEMANILKLARNDEGYLMEAHVKLRPVDLAKDGIFVCGTAHGPKLISEAVTQALAAAARASVFLSQSEITLSAVKATVDPERCAACLICVYSCPFEVPKINADGVSEINEALCQGCGICAGECPAKAIQLNWYEDDQILGKVEALLEGVL